MLHKEPFGKGLESIIPKYYKKKEKDIYIMNILNIQMECSGYWRQEDRTQ